MNSIQTQTCEIALLIDGAWVKRRVQVTVDFHKLATVSGRDAAKTKAGQVTHADRAVIVRLIGDAQKLAIKC